MVIYYKKMDVHESYSSKNKMEIRGVGLKMDRNPGASSRPRRKEEQPKTPVNISVHNGAVKLIIYTPSILTPEV